ncbi:MAG: hypothetical protein PHC88_14235 [Terrimicrobiaceae bacterium]|nr:hypothetical protein [Terrimicrobiaceae bacterium]
MRTAVSTSARFCASHAAVIPFTERPTTVRDLRNHFADVAKWIERDEAVTITRNGAPFATLAAARRPRRQSAPATRT